MFVYFLPRATSRLPDGAGLQGEPAALGGGSSSVAWHPDGRRLFVGAGDAAEIQEYLFNPTTHQLFPARLLQVPSSGGNTVAINSAGNFRLPAMGGDDSQQVPGIGTDRLGIQQPSIVNFRPDEIAGPMVLKSEI